MPEINYDKFCYVETLFIVSENAGYWDTLDAMNRVFTGYLVGYMYPQPTFSDYSGYIPVFSNTPAHRG